MSKLIIAEKMSVGQSIAAVLGAAEKHNGYIQGNGYTVSWCIGHLVQLATPDAYGKQYAKWRYADLPIIPERWKYIPIAGKEKQLKTISDLMNRTDVDCVVNACDAGREGELIFRLVYEYCQCKKPIERLWISSMEEQAILDGFNHLHAGSEYENLYQSALCRAKADWLVGINATRLFSVLYSSF